MNKIRKFYFTLQKTVIGAVTGALLGTVSGALIGTTIGFILPGAKIITAILYGVSICGLIAVFNSLVGIPGGVYSFETYKKFIQDNTIGIGFSTPMIIGETINIIRGKKNNYGTPGVVVIEIPFSIKTSFSIGLLPLIFTGKGNTSDPEMKAHFQHEYGHSLQFRQLGLLGIIILVLSIFSYHIFPEKHRSRIFEIDANKRAVKYYGPDSEIAKTRRYRKKQSWE
jgi:hypothetical protein